jgi:hypothetical protein
MVDFTMVQEDSAGDRGGGSGRKRDRTLIEFPYSDLNRSAEMTSALGLAGGKAWIDQTQLAVAMNMTVTGGTFRGRLSAARMFGFIETEGGKVRLSDLGIRLLDDATEKEAKAEGFLNVPLYRVMYESYNGMPLPPAAAIERQMISVGVPSKQAERARQAFASSAQAAGFIAINGRFSKPTFASVEEPQPSPDKGQDNDGGSAGSGAGGGNLHPFIQGLLETLPQPGTDWSANERADWLNAAATMFKLIYKGGGNVTVKADTQQKTGADQE